ncbi:MAG: hypothetical protein WC884_04200 [Candidatus Paceibacterota bacterium]
MSKGDEVKKEVVSGEKDEKSIKKVEEKETKDTTSVPEKKEDDGVEEEDFDAEWKGASCILSDGSLVEMLYDAKACESKLAVYKDGKVSLEDKVRIDGMTVFTPFAPNQDILRTKYVLFPSRVGDYQSNEALYYEVRAFVDKYVQLPEEFLSVVAVYVMLSWVYDKFQNIPYLRVVGLFGTGKSRLLSAVGHLCYKAVMAGGSISNAALFRTLDLFNPTLIFDEAELSEKESADMRQVLRQGYSAGTPVSRMDKSPSGKMYIQIFNVFGPKIIASQARFSDIALESRCLTQWMYPLAKNTRPIELSENFKEEALLLRNKLIMFRFRNHGLVVADEEALGEVSLPRLKQTGLAVVSIAKMLCPQALNDVLKFLSEYEEELRSDQADSVENDVLLCVLDLLTQKYITESGKIRAGVDLTEKFNRLHYEDYADRETKEYSSNSKGLLIYPGAKVSAKKIGGYVRRMGFKIERDGKGFYIPVAKEYSKIRLLARRYGLDSLYEIPENNPNGVKRIVDDVEKLNNLKLREENKKKKEEEERRKKELAEKEKNRKPMSDEEYKEIFGDDSREQNTPPQS